MYKKLFSIIFIVFAYFVFETCFSVVRNLDSSLILAWYEQPEFKVTEYQLAPNLSGHEVEAILGELVYLSDKYQVNLFVRTRNLPSLVITSKRGQNLWLYAYLQEDEYLTRLPVSNLEIVSAEEFNQAVGMVISNSNVHNKLGHLSVTSGDYNYFLSSVLSLSYEEILSSVFITHREEEQIAQFCNELKKNLPELQLNVIAHNKIRRQEKGFLGSLLLLHKNITQNLIIAATFLLLTTLIYIFQRKRDILIYKLQGLSGTRILFNLIRPVLGSAILWSLPWAIPFYFINNGQLNFRLFTVYSMYLFALVLLVAVFLGFCILAQFYILRLRPVALVKYMETDTLLLGTSFVIKTAIVPLVILSLAVSAYTFTDSIGMRGRIDNYKSQYQDYVSLLGGSPGEYIGLGEEGTYINRVFQVLETEGLAVYFQDRTYSGGLDFFPITTTYAFTNYNYVNKLQILDYRGQVVSLNAGQEYVLVPELHWDKFVHTLYLYPGHLTSFISAYIDLDPRSVTGADVQQALESHFLKIMDNQPIPHFNLYLFASMSNTIEDYILIINQHWVFRPINADEIFLDVSGLNNYQQIIEDILAREGLRQTLGYVSTDESLALASRETRVTMFISFRESLLYIILLAYISILTMFFYYQVHRHEIAVKFLHGHRFGVQFIPMLVANLVLNSIIFLYLITQGSYFGIQVAFGVARGIKLAFGAMLLLDCGILMLSLLSLKYKMMLALKRNR